MKNLQTIILLILFGFINYLSAQGFNVEKFTDPAKYGWENPRQQIESRKDLLTRQKLLQVYEMNKFRYRDKLIKSALVPGWTQFVAKKYAKGQIILGLEVALFVSSFYYYDQTMNYYDKYKKAEYICDIDDYYEKTKSPWRNCQLFLGMGIVVWIYNIYDTFVVVEDYNRELWQKIYLDYYNKKISVSPNGITLRF